LRPVADRLGCAEELLRAKRILDVGPSYLRQRESAAAAGGNLSAVVDGLLAEMRGNAPAGLAL
jgi:glutamate---cysteine ligase / carboxylate-amine ligase